ncbi:MAG TPA: DNA-binding protein, partial [Prolixibacteraceae bacterium]|nr:DNA-binding protein [Prolixibacteraceae bacterium]
KIIEIALKVGKYPVFEFQDKQTYWDKKSKISNTKTISLDYNWNAYSNIPKTKNNNSDIKVISLQPNHSNNIQFAVR